MNELLDAALKYTRYGWHVFPIVPKGKRPLTPHGFKDASAAESAVRQWWARWPGANIGIATGASGLVVVDLDGKEGIAAWALGKANNPGMNDDTLTSLTGGGGIHLIFLAPESTIIGNSASKLAPHIDIRGMGGYIIAPPSVHPSGKKYQWDMQCHREPLPLPPAVLAALMKQGAQIAKPIASEILERERNSTLASLAGTMRRRGMSEAAICVALMITNTEQCRPPLPLAEVQRIAANYARYNPA